VTAEIDFEAINRRALAMLPELLREWLPGGRLEGDEYVARNPTRADRTAGSFKINVRTAQWADFVPSGPYGTDVVGFYAYINAIEQGEAAKRVGHRVGVEKANGAAYGGAKQEHKWIPILVPDGLRLPDGGRWPDGMPFPQHNQLGAPNSIIWFHNQAGAVIAGECRFETTKPDGTLDKEVRPLTFCCRDDGKVAPDWRWKAPPKPYTLFNLPSLAGDNKPVLVTEGARKAQVGAELFPDFAATAALFGARSPHLADWSPLAGRAVVIWPDHDDAGREFANLVARLAAGAGAVSVAIVEIPEHWPAKWDLRDRLPEGATDETLAELLRDARLRVAEPESEQTRSRISLDDFYAYMPMHSYIFVPTRAMWPAGSINARIPPIPVGPEKTIPASLWLDQKRPVEQMTWAPGLPMIIKNRLIAEGGWFDRNNASCFNLYLPPVIKPGDAKQAGKWIDHVRRVFGDDNASHVIKWLAQRVQRPQDKINHALMLGGKQGIGKDTLLEPVKRAIGPWNFSEASPQQVVGRFNGFLKSVILRINEARDLGEVDRFQFYDHMKAYTAAPPDVLRVDEKYLREHYILNCCGVIITTNHKTDGIFLPPDDRRHFVAWSDLAKENFTDSYWHDLYGWYDNGGAEHVAAYLAELDLSGFDAKAPPAKTQAFWEIVDSSRVPEDAELADLLDKIHENNTVQFKGTVTLAQLANWASSSPFGEWLRDRRNARRIPHRLEDCGYVAVRNTGSADGLWKVDGKRQVIYVAAELTPQQRFDAAAKRAGARSA
jgi:Family of unknown function (DUF5906)